MTNQTYKNEGTHADVEYITKQVMSMPGLQITEFVKGQCFICRQKLEDKEAWIHLSCANAYQDKKNDNLKIFMESQKGVKSR